ncbi:MAG: hypothetical protein M1829_005490 [Trizodia sp. TS-e1964]|nr:MAG: hypothetical protein M1829_005490 [Trizodia sp. TS-e1964]
MHRYNQNTPPGGAHPNLQSWRQPQHSSYAAPPNPRVFNPAASESSVSLVSTLSAENGSSTTNSSQYFYRPPQFNYQPPASASSGNAYPPPNPHFPAQQQQQQQQQRQPPWNPDAFGIQSNASHTSSSTGAGPSRINNDSQRTVSLHSSNSGQSGNTPSTSPITKSPPTFSDVPSSRGRTGSNGTVQSAPTMSLAEQIRQDERREKARLELMRLSNEEQQRLQQLMNKRSEESRTETNQETSSTAGSSAGQQPAQQQPILEPMASINAAPFDAPTRYPQDVTDLPHKYNFAPARAAPPVSENTRPRGQLPPSLTPGGMFSDVDEMVNRLRGPGSSQQPQPSHTSAHELPPTTTTAQQRPPIQTAQPSLQELPNISGRYAPAAARPNTYELSHSPSVLQRPAPLPPIPRPELSATPSVYGKTPLPYPSTSSMPCSTKYAKHQSYAPPPNVAELDSAAAQRWEVELEAPFGGGGMPPTAWSSEDLQARRAREEEERRRLQREVEAWTQQKQGPGSWQTYQ